MWVLSFQFGSFFISTLRRVDSVCYNNGASLISVSILSVESRKWSFRTGLLRGGMRPVAHWEPLLRSFLAKAHRVYDQVLRIVFSSGVVGLWLSFGIIWRLETSLQRSEARTQRFFGRDRKIEKETNKSKDLLKVIFKLRFVLCVASLKSVHREPGLKKVRNEDTKGVPGRFVTDPLASPKLLQILRSFWTLWRTKSYTSCLARY